MVEDIYEKYFLMLRIEKQKEQFEHLKKEYDLLKHIKKLETELEDLKKRKF